MVVTQSTERLAVAGCDNEELVQEEYDLVIFCHSTIRLPALQTTRTPRPRNSKPASFPTAARACAAGTPPSRLPHHLRALVFCPLVLLCPHWLPDAQPELKGGIVLWFFWFILHKRAEEPVNNPARPILCEIPG